LTQLPNALGVSWSACADADYRETEVWEASSNNRATASQIATVTGTQLQRSGLTGGAVRYYWVRHVDTSGNVSAWYPSSATGGVSGTAGADPGNTIQHDFTGFLAGGATGYLTGAGYWLGYSSGWKLHFGDPSGQHIKFDGTNFHVVGGLVSGTLTVNTTGAIAMGATAYLTGSGLWMGYTGGTYKAHLGNPSGAHIKWDGSDFMIVGGLVTGSVQVAKSPEAFTYDLDGNLTSDSLWTNTWNGENRRVTKNGVEIDYTGVLPKIVSGSNAFKITLTGSGFSISVTELHYSRFY
jgi:hypothetical protein